MTRVQDAQERRARKALLKFAVSLIAAINTAYIAASPDNYLFEQAR